MELAQDGADDGEPREDRGWNYRVSANADVQSS